MLLNCESGEDSWESLWLQGDPTSPSRSSVLDVHWKDWYRSWNFNPLATWCKELTHWKRLWCWERLMGGGEGDDRGWWTRVWLNPGNWWWTRRPGVLWFMGSQRVGHDLGTKQQQSSCGDTFSLIGQQKVTTADILSLCHLLKKKRLLSLFVFSLSLNLYSVILVSYLKHRPTHPHL